MQRPLVAGNWKMNGDAGSARELAGALAKFSCAGTDVAVCPPYPYLAMVSGILRDSSIMLGAQDVAHQEAGAYTGAVAASMLKDVGCDMVIIGHSERRSVFGESDEQVAAKCARAQGLGLIPIICVGETLAEREAGQTMEVVLRQMMAVIDHCGAEALNDTVLAYEPVWAIGTGQTATPEQAQDVHRALRQRLSDVGARAHDIRLIYGGSVKPDNAVELFAMQDIDGGLIGGAALVAADFQAICEAAEG